MPKVNTSWNVLPHLPIEKLEPNLWRVQGTMQGMALKRVMALVKLDDGRVVVHSAISLDDASMAELEAWGTPAVLLVPNAYHRIDAPAWVERYPGIQVWCPKGGRKKIEEVVRVDGVYDDLDLGEDITVEYLDGIKKVEGVVIVRSESGTTLVFNDALFNMPHATGLAGFILRYITQSTGGPRVSRLFRLFAVKDRNALADHFERLAGIPDLVRLIVSHHRVITDQPAETLRRVAADLKG
jgi:hypothetical protein